MILLDTHVWIWWVNGVTESIPQQERELIARASAVGVSAISCLEMSWLVRRGRIELDMPTTEWFDLALEGSGIELLPLTPGIADRAANLPEHQRILPTASSLQRRLSARARSSASMGISLSTRS